MRNWMTKRLSLLKTHSSIKTFQSNSTVGSLKQCLTSININSNEAQGELVDCRARGRFASCSAACLLDRNRYFPSECSLRRIAYKTPRNLQKKTSIYRGVGGRKLKKFNKFQRILANLSRFQQILADFSKFQRILASFNKIFCLKPKKIGKTCQKIRYNLPKPKKTCQTC